MNSIITPLTASTGILALPVAVSLVIAEAGASIPDWVGSGIHMSSFAIVAWLVHFMFTKQMPAAQAQHAAEVIAQRETHTKSMETIAAAHVLSVKLASESFEKSLTQQRVDFKDEMMRERTFCNGVSDNLREITESVKTILHTEPYSKKQV